MSALNARAGELFDAGDSAAYMGLMTRLHADGLISAAELAQHSAAVRVREAELKGSGRELNGSGQDANGPAAVSDAQRSALAAALAGGVGPSAPAPSGPGPVPSTSVLLDAATGGPLLQHARQLWESEESRAAWVGPLAQHANGLLGEAVSGAAAAVSAVSFDEARAAWGAYVAAAGNPAGEVHFITAPSLLLCFYDRV